MQKITLEIRGSHGYYIWIFFDKLQLPKHTKFEDKSFDQEHYNFHTLYYYIYSFTENLIMDRQFDSTRI